MTGSCCQPVLETPAVAVVARKSGPLDASSFATTIDSHATLVPVIALWPAIASSAHSTPPPFDAVIVYSHLTI
jgi:hypothetical protein